MNINEHCFDVNFARICNLLMYEGTECLRQKVKDHLNPNFADLTDAVRANKSDFADLRKKHILQPMQYEALYPCVGDIDESRIDMSLWFFLARNVTAGRKKVRWKESPRDGEIKWQHDIIRIRDMRNELFHRESSSLDDMTFREMRAKLTLILRRLGSNSEDVESHFTRDLDPMTTERTIMRLKEQMMDDFSQMGVLASKQRKHNACIALILVTLTLVLVIGIPVLVVTLKPERPCSEHITRKVAHSGVLNFMTREGWGAATATGHMLNLSRPVPEAVVLHTAYVQSECKTTEDCCRVVRQIQTAHMKGNLWDDIAYNYLIANDGVVYEGRGSHYVGSAVGGQNTKMISVAMMGNFMCHPPSEVATMALYVFLEYIMDHDPEAPGDKPVLASNYSLYGHCQAYLNPKKPFHDSPGAAMMHQIKYWDHWKADNITNCTMTKDCLASSCCTPCSTPMIPTHLPTSESYTDANIIHNALNMD